MVADFVLRDNGSDREAFNAFQAEYHIPPVDISPETVLDLGSNIGLTLWDYKRLWPDAFIVGVEMDRECALLAAKNSGVTVFNEAITADGRFGKYDSRLWPTNFSFGKTGDTETSSRSLHDFILEVFGEPVDFCKMDIEGMEWELLEDGRFAPLVKSLLVELHGHDVYDGPVLLRELGYQTQRVKHPLAVWAWRDDL